MHTIGQLYDQYYKPLREVDTLKEKWQTKANEISKLFNVRRPSIKINTRIDARGKYRRLTQTIQMGKQSDEQTLLHEMAHHITFERFGRQGRPHGRKFKGILWAVVNKHYPNPADYSWDNEYSSVKKYGKKRIAKKSYEPCPLQEIRVFEDGTKTYSCSKCPTLKTCEN
jgi:predicted SprT family Zn-dependent metalloprotease